MRSAMRRPLLPLSVSSFPSAIPQPSPAGGGENEVSVEANVSEANVKPAQAGGRSQTEGHSMRLKTLALAMAGLPAAALAADAAILDEIVVTATRTAQTADETLASVTVITRKDIERSQAQSVQDLLRGLPGVSVANSGGLGKATSVFLRGTESDHVLVLIDGVKVGSATSGQAAFQDLPVEQIERIEVVRGPRSSLYGSEAIGGVIQIFTRKGGGATKPHFSLGGGSYKTWQGSAGLTGGGEQGWFSLGVSGIDTAGFNACKGSPSWKISCGVIEPDRDGYRNVSGSLRAGYRFDNGAEADFHWLRARADNEYDGSFVNASESVQQVLGGRLGISPAEAWRATLLLARSRDDSDNFKDGVFKSRFNTRRDTASLQNDFTVAAGQFVTVGLDVQRDSVESGDLESWTPGFQTYARTSRDNNGLFVQYRAGFGAQDVQLSLRRDDNEQFGGHTTGSAAWGYALSQTLRLIASYGTAFKAPTFNELYFPDYGNPNLGPEESQSLELGLSGRSVLGQWSLNAFQTRVDNLIAYDSATRATANVDEARILGLEAVVATQILGWDAKAGMTLLDPEQEGGKYDGKTLPRRAKQALRLDADRAIGAYSLGATVRAEGRRYDDLANATRLGGYAVVDLRAEHALARDWRLQGRIENLFDKDYETAHLYNQPGRSLFVTLRYQPR